MKKYTSAQDLETTHDMWKKLKRVYGGDLHAQKAKVDILKGNFKEMRIMENKNIEQYSQKIKNVVCSIKVLVELLRKRMC